MAIQYSFERYEKKYFLDRERRDILLEHLAERMIPDEYGQYTLCNIYYDTDDWRLIRQSIANGGYKEKLRVRSYGVPAEDGKVFVELKRKCGGIVYKRRISAPALLAERMVLASAGLTPEGGAGILPAGESVPSLTECGQVGRELDWFERGCGARPRVFIGYDRQAFAGREDSSLRVTLDTNLRYRLDRLDLRAGDDGSLLMPEDRVLMEIKIPGACPIWLSRLLSELDIRQASFSKYGTCYREHILPEIYAPQLTESMKEALLSA